DVRMPPGWDGVETIARIWQVYPALQVVVCTAYSDYSWEEMRAKVGQADSLLVLKKPFDNVEVQQLAHALTKKWMLSHEAALQMAELAKANKSLTISEERFSKAFYESPLPSGIQSFPDQPHLLLLAQDVSQRALLERELRQAQKMEAIGQLAAGVAHDFNNILTVIQGHAGLMQHKLEPGSLQTKPLQQIVNAADRATT